MSLPRPARTTLALAATAVLFLLGCATDHSKPPPGTPYAAHGITVRLAPGWHPAKRSLTPRLSDPREALAVATYPLRYRATGCSHVAGSALQDLRPTDAFVTLTSRSGRRP